MAEIHGNIAIIVKLQGNTHKYWVLRGTLPVTTDIGIAAAILTMLPATPLL